MKLIQIIKAATAFALCLLLGLALIPDAVMAQNLENGRDGSATRSAPTKSKEKSIVEKGSDRDDGGLTQDQVVNDDQIVVGSLCVGFDCVNGESFGFDTIRLKENNLRIDFLDTSTSASFPRNDWKIRINDSSNGGGSYFAVEDASAGRTPFRVDAGAPTDALRVDSQGDVGVGVGSPVVELHVKDGDTPTLRLEQDGSSGFTPQTWDLAGNETNFFIRDVTNGSQLPFRIRPDAPTSSIDVSASGNVGFGTSSPDAQLHVLEGDVTNPSVFTYDDFILETDESIGGATILTPSTSSAGYFFADPDNGIAGGIQYLHPLDRLSFQTNGAVRMYIASDGEVFVGGSSVHAASDRRLKKNVEPISDALSAIRELEGVRFQWIDKAKNPGVQIGLIAQDVEKIVPEVVATQQDEMGTKSVSYASMVPLLIEAIKEQQAIIDAQRESLSSMEAQLGSVQSSMQRLEAMLTADQAAAKPVIRSNTSED